MGGNGVRGELRTPIRQELHHILSYSAADHVILIDYARLFVGRHDYPTLEEVQSLILERRPYWTIEVSDDIIHCHKEKAQSGGLRAQQRADTLTAARGHRRARVNDVTGAAGRGVRQGTRRGGGRAGWAVASSQTARS